MAMMTIPDWYDGWKTTPPEPDYVLTCDECGTGIYEGEEFYEICGDRLCEHCAKEWFDGQMRPAEREEP